MLLRTWFLMLICLHVKNSVPSNVLSVEPLSGSNFKKWKEDITISLGLADLDIALRTPPPDTAHATGTNQ